MDSKLNSSYQDSFKDNKKTAVESSCKPRQKYNPNPNKMKYKTEYSDVYIQQKMNKKNDFQCLSPEQLKNYVMNILS
jgi:hypothetical protein